jgi:transposase-like protein
MNTRQAEPKTLQEAIRYFADPKIAADFVAELRWQDGAECPACQSKNVVGLSTRPVYKCRECKKQFSVKVGTIFEDSPLGLDKWLPALWMIANCKNGVSSYEIGRALGVTQKTAWFMLHRIRLAMQSKSFVALDGEVEIDETWIGGKARNMHVAKRRGRLRGGRGVAGKTVVLGLLERHGLDKKKGSKIRAKVITRRTKQAMHMHVTNEVKPGAAIFTDEFGGYKGLEEFYKHNVINHAECYAKGNIHTNSVENFWSLLKRGIRGTYVSVEPFHLFRYLDEQVFRFNNRKEDDKTRFAELLGSVLGRRLTYKSLIGEGFEPLPPSPAFAS